MNYIPSTYYRGFGSSSFQQIGRNPHNFERGPPGDSPFEFLLSGRNIRAPIDYSPTSSNRGVINSNFRGNHTNCTPTIDMGTSASSQNVLAPQSSSSFSRLMRMPQLSRLPQPTFNAAKMLPNLETHFGERDNRNPIQVPVESATHAHILARITGVSPNYQGDPCLRANQPANIPNELNTSVWITNLPPNLDHKMLLDSVRNCGKVYAAVVNGPEQGHITSASKLVFFDVAGAQNLLKQCSEGSFLVGGYMPRVCYNRIKTEAKPPSPASRVLHIEGPSSIVNQPYLANLFQSDGITWQDEAVIVLSSTILVTRLEWRFGSYRCQAESSRYLIDRMKRRHLLISGEYDLWQRVTVHFGVDPCAPQPGT